MAQPIARLRTDVRVQEEDAPLLDRGLALVPFADRHDRMPIDAEFGLQTRTKYRLKARYQKAPVPAFAAFAS